MKTNKILYLRTDFASEKMIAGGSIAHTIGVVGGFLKEGIEVVCAAPCIKHIFERLQPTAIKELSKPPIVPRFSWRIRCVLGNVWYTKQLLSLFKKHHFDFLYYRYSLLNMTAVLLKWWKKIPLILEYNGSESWIDEHWRPLDRSNYRFLARWIEKKNLQHADHIVVVSQVLKEELLKRGVDEKKIILNPNGVDAAKFNPAILQRDRELVRNNYNLEEKFVFGFIGSFSIWHGVETLAAMIPEVIHRKPNAAFLLIGEGPYFVELKTTLQKAGIPKDRVVLTGLVPQHEAHKYLAACDAYLSPTKANTDGTKFFGSPTKLFEYMSMAKPVIASDLEQIAQVLGPAVRFFLAKSSTPLILSVRRSSEGAKANVSKECGLLVKPGDVQGFAQAACRFVEADKDVLKRMGENGRKKILEKHTWQSHVRTILKHVGGL